MSPLIFDPSFSLLKKKEEEQADDGGKRSVVKFEDELDDEDDVVRKANEMFIEEMTPQVCFDFCKAHDGFGYFGLKNGRECYCTPYYKAKAGSEGELCVLWYTDSDVDGYLWSSALVGEVFFVGSDGGGEQYHFMSSS